MIIIDILVAIGSVDIKRKIDEKYGKRVYYHDISYKEDVIDYLEKYNKEHIIITRLNLPGNLDYISYIKKLKEINTSNKIIILTDKLNKKDKEFLFANEIFNIIEGNEINIDLIYNQIETDQKIIYKTIYENISEKKKKIAIFGTDGAGKSFIASLISKNIAKYTKEKVVLVALDTKNPCIDIINNLNCVNFNIGDYLVDIEKDSNNIYKYINKSNSYKNLCYINSNNKIELNNLNVKLDNVVRNLSQKFEYVIFDLANNTLNTSFKKIIDLVDEIIFVINPNYISLRQAKKYLEYICINTNINKDKIKLVVNKDSKYSLDIKQIKSILKNFEKCINIKYIKEIEAYINGIIYDIPFIFKEEQKLLDLININYNKKKYDKNTIRKVD